MKGQGSTTKFTGEERVHSSDGSSLFKRLLEVTKKPAIVNSEAIKTANKAVANEVKSEFNVAISQIFGIELKAGKTHKLSAMAEQAADIKPKAEKGVITAEHMSYFSEFKRTSEKKGNNEDTNAIREQLGAILAELRKLKDSSDELETVFKDVVIDEVPEKPGVYHLTFYEGFLKLVMKMRDRVEDGVVYAKLFRSRKAEKSYTSMAKKGGTSFTLHHDRNVATQTG